MHHAVTSASSGIKIASFESGGIKMVIQITVALHAIRVFEKKDLHWVVQLKLDQQ